MSYPPERLEAVLKKMLPSYQPSIPDLAREEVMAEPTPHRIPGIESLVDVQDPEQGAAVVTDFLGSISMVEGNI